MSNSPEILSVKYIKNRSLESVEAEANSQIRNGWSLYGAVVCHPYRSEYVQTMVKYEIGGDGE